MPGVLIERVLVPIGFTFCVSAVVAVWLLIAIVIFLRRGHVRWLVDWLARRRWGHTGRIDREEVCEDEWK